MSGIIKISEVVVVEGRDDEAAVLRAADAPVICTHGYGISKETIEKIKHAYETKGIIIFTDPDHAGLNIRKKLTGLFPSAKQAHLTRGEAESKGDIGIENASPQAIAAALAAAGRTERAEAADLPDAEDLFDLGLNGSRSSAALREAAGAELGIGGGNGRAFLHKLQRMGISRKELAEACQKAAEKIQ